MARTAHPSTGSDLPAHVSASSNASVRLIGSDWTTSRIAAAGVLASAAIISAALLISRAGYVPMWDGFIYAEAINDALARPTAPNALRFAGHASHVYGALAVAAQALAPGRFWPMLLLDSALFAAACVGFARLLRLAYGAAEHQVDRALLTAAFCLQPSVLGAVVQPGIDLPLVPGFIWCTVFLLERRWLATIIVGLALAFTKETGVLLYATLLASYALWLLVRTAGPARDRIGVVVRLAPYVVPGVVFGLYLLWRKYAAPAGEPVVWNAGTGMIGHGLLHQLVVPRIDRHLASSLAMMGVLNFTWVMTACIGAAGLVLLRRVLRGASWRERWQTLERDAATVPGFVVLLTVASAYALSRFATYANPRYVLPVVALMYVPFFGALLALGLTAAVRRGILAAFTVVLLVSTVRTVDPVSRALFGTFAFGERSMLRMTSITHECCGAGRDQLVYNLEFTTLEALTGDALASIAPRDSALVVFPDSTNWYVAMRLDPATRRRTVARHPAVVPTVFEYDQLDSLPVLPSSGHYVALPNASPAVGLAVLARYYAIGPERRVRRGDRWLSFYSLTRPDHLAAARGPRP